MPAPPPPTRSVVVVGGVRSGPGQGLADGADDCVVFAVTVLDQHLIGEIDERNALRAEFAYDARDDDLPSIGRDHAGYVPSSPVNFTVTGDPIAAPAP